jgi:hypothetical protein
MHNDQRHRSLPVCLPMTMAEHLDIGFHREQALFRRRKLIATWQEVAGNGLGMSTDEGTPGAKRLAEEILRANGFGGTMLRLVHFNLMAAENGPRSYTYNSNVSILRGWLWFYPDRNFARIGASDADFRIPLRGLRT